MAYENQCGSCDNFEDRRNNSPYDTNNYNYEKGYCSWYRTYYYPDDSCISHYRARSGSSSNCYITTMLCNRLGLADDCCELQTLRSFRDNVLQQNKDYQELLYEYDVIGPAIAANLQTEEISVIKKLFDTYIKPVISLLREGKNESAISKYVEMTCSLEDYYGLTEITEVPENYDYSQGGHGKLLLKSITGLEG